QLRPRSYARAKLTMCVRSKLDMPLTLAKLRVERDQVYDNSPPNFSLNERLMKSSKPYACERVRSANDPSLSPVAWKRAVLRKSLEFKVTFWKAVSDANTLSGNFTSAPALLWNARCRPPVRFGTSPGMGMTKLGAW